MNNNYRMQDFLLLVANLLVWMINGFISILNRSDCRAEQALPGSVLLF
jgi:hypothetical protein